MRSENYGLRPISVKGQWGYVDTSGEVRLLPQFVSASEFSEGLAVVTFTKKTDHGLSSGRENSGFIDCSGKVVIPDEPQSPVDAIEWRCSYGDFHEGLARYRYCDMGSDSPTGFIDKGGRTSIPAKFDTIHDFSSGLVFVTTWCPFDDYQPKRQGYINRKGTFVIESKRFIAGGSFRDGFAPVTIRAGDAHNLNILIDQFGKQVLGPYSRISELHGGSCIVWNGEKVALFDRNGREIVPFGRYDAIEEPENGVMYTASRNQQWYILSASGKEVATAPRDCEVEFFSDGLVPFIANERYGFLDISGNVVVEAIYVQVESFRGGLARVYLDATSVGLGPKQRVGYIDRKGRLVWETDMWDAPLRFGIDGPISRFVPDTVLAQLPFSRSIEAKNAVVFVADERAKKIRQWYVEEFSAGYDVTDSSDTCGRSGRIELRLVGDGGDWEVNAIDADDEEANHFVDFYCCENMSNLRTEYPQCTIGIVIQNM